jgi:predicted methyltransferase
MRKSKETMEHTGKQWKTHENTCNGKRAIVHKKQEQNHTKMMHLKIQRTKCVLWA